MDQLRTALTWLQRQHFWVLSVLAPLIALGCWWKASGQLGSAYAANQSAINAEFTSVQGLRKDPFHANDAINEKQAAQTKLESESVAKLWQQLYDRQREHVLTWPVPPLSKEFGDYVEKLQFGANIPDGLRSNYRDYVFRHFRELPKQIEARELEVSGTNGGPGGEFSRQSYGMPGGPIASGAEDLQDENDYVCAWLDQGVVREELTFRDRPSSLRIWVTQEDLWVYHTMLDVIAKTNRAAGATRMSNAAVKTIYQMVVGREAGKFSRTPGRLMVPPPAPQTGGPGAPGGPESPGGPGAPAGPGGPGGPEMMGPGGPGGVTNEAQESIALLWGRYLDAQGKPIPFSGGGAPASGGDTPSAQDPAAAAPPFDASVFGLEYKRLPVRMVLQMDQRWLPRLISECASEPLQIEVQEVRINPPDAAGGMGGGPVGNFRMEGGPGGGGAGAASFPEENGAVLPFTSRPEIANVVIQGTIYIFNKPNASILQVPGEQQPVAVNGG